MKRCVDCKHFVIPREGTVGTAPHCRHPKNIETDYVFGASGGRLMYQTAQAVRLVKDMCGPDGKWHEERANG